MTRSFDTIVLGGGIDALVSALTLARGGTKVMVLVPESHLGAELRQIEFSPGFHAAPLGHDLGWVPPDLLALSGLESLPLLASDPTLVAFGEGGPLAFRRSPGATAQSIAALSTRDAARWPKFCQQSAALAGFLAGIYRRPVSRINDRSPADLMDLLRGARGFRALGRHGMQELLHTFPAAIADVLDDWFETPLLKGALAALAVRDIGQGPMSGGTAFNWIHQLVGAPSQGFPHRTVLPGGASNLLAAYEHQARQHGVSIQTNAPVRRLLVEQDAVSGVELESGEHLRSREVISALDPYRTLLELLDPLHLEAETIQTIRQIRYRAATSIALLALEHLPPMPQLDGVATGAFLFAPTIGAVERAYDATKYGRISEEPVVELGFPSIANPALAPVGKHVAVLRVQYTPGIVRGLVWDSALRESIGARALKVVEAYLPGFGASISAGQVLAPPDLERLFGLRGGAIGGPELALDQILFMRPFPAASRHAAPLAGLFLCGHGTHPGPGIAGVSGQLAAQRLLACRKAR